VRGFKIICVVKIKIVIFDLDGTVVENEYDWQAIKKELGVEGGSILSYLDSLPEPARSEKYSLLKEYEKEQTEKAVLKEGIKELLAELKTKGIKRGLVTNNSMENADLLLKKFELEFDLVLTRESGLHKPTAEPFRAVMKHFNCGPEETLVVGDTNYDLVAAREAGINHVFILKSKMTPEHLDGAELLSVISELGRRIKQLLAEN
jgi:HAD superfamily hydrolase (TIGR01549 family)